MASIGSVSPIQWSPSLYMLPQPPQDLAGLSGSPLPLVQDAVSLSSESLLAASLGGGSGGSTTTASTLLQSFDQAGTPASVSVSLPAGVPATAAATDSLDQSLINTLAIDPASAGIYTAQGVVQALPLDVSGNWALALSSQPALAATMVGDTLDQGIVSGLSVYA